MLLNYREVASCAPSRHDDVYIFSTAPLAGNGLAAITSADELLLLHDKGSLNSSTTSTLSDCPQGPSSLVVADAGQTVICAGSDGRVVVYDIRTQTKAAEFKIGNLRLDPCMMQEIADMELCTGKAANAIACRGTDVAVGSEAVVSVWQVSTHSLWQVGVG